MNYQSRLARITSALNRRFVRLLQDEPLSEETPHRVTIDHLFDELKVLYGKRYRWYHTFEHIDAMFTEFDTLFYRLDRWDLVALAIYYHDVIYVPGAKDNEEKSAEFMASRIAPLGVPIEDLETIKRLIIVGTKHPKSAQAIETLTNDERHISDLDLSGFSRSLDYVLEMAYNVRREFAILDDDTFKSVQGEFLLALLRQRIYLTDCMGRHEEKARENIKHVLGELDTIVRARPSEMRR